MGVGVVKSQDMRARRGSALVIAVAMVALLASIGVAFLVSSRNALRSAHQHHDNTQANLLADGAANLTRAAISIEQPGMAHPRRGRMLRDLTVSPQTDSFIASRVPVRMSEIAAPWDAGRQEAGGEYPRTYFRGDYVTYGGRCWVCRTTHVASAATAPPAPTYWLDSQTSADSPVWPAASRSFDAARSADIPIDQPAYSVRSIMHPMSSRIGSQLYPALAFYDPASDRMRTVIAADSDGDGIADAPLLRLMNGPVHGIDYFYAVRVIDSNSAVNASVAWQPDEGAEASVRGALFPSNVNLLHLLRGWTAEMERLNHYRFNLPASAAALDYQAARIDDLGRLRTDFEFTSPCEALWVQLGRRMDNPGYTGAPATGAVRPRFAPLPASDSGVLAYAGGALVQNGAATPSPIESLLKDSLLASVSLIPPYDAGAMGVSEWFDGFDYLGEIDTDRSTWKSRRPLLTTSNPVSSLAPGLDMAPLAAKGEPAVTSSADEPGKMPISSAPPIACVNTAPFGELWRAFWNVMAEDWSASRTPLGDWLDYQTQHSPAGTYDDPYLGTRFDAGTFLPMAQQHPARMFRSPIRAVPRGGAEQSFDAGTPRLGPDQVLLLRSAIAALNTVAIRSPDEVVPFQDIHLNVKIGAKTQPVSARIYGIKRQPYFTEVYAQTDTGSPSPGDFTVTNPNGYIAIEIYNPYSFPIDLINCKLAAIERASAPASRSSADPGPSIINLSTQALPVSFSAARSNLGDFDQPSIGPTIIPPNGFLVLENYDPRDPSDAARDARAAGYRPAASGLPSTGLIPAGLLPRANFAFVPNLDRVLGNELLLLRPPGAAYVKARIHNVNYNGTEAPAVLRYEGVAAIADLVPLDAYDFTGLGSGGAANGDGHAVAWHYARAAHPPAIAGDVNKAWHFVYPGRYSAEQPALGNRPAPRQQGTQSETWDPSATSDPWAAAPPLPGISLGSDGGSTTSGLNFNATYPTEFTIRLADAHWPDHHAPAASTGNRYPFGGFARRLDILQVPFIGAYRLQLDGQPGTNLVLELNPVTIDSIFAEDTDVTDDAAADSLRHEQIGRFAPLASDLAFAVEGEARGGSSESLVDPDRTEPARTWDGCDLLIVDGPGRGQVRTIVSSDPSSGTLHVVRDWEIAPGAGTRYAIRGNHYAWAARLFDYLDVLAPGGGLLPNIDPASYAWFDPAKGRYRAIDPAPTPLTPAPYPATQSPAIEGQININTAPWKVLAAVPFFAADQDRMDFRLDNPDGKLAAIPVLEPNGISDNDELARAIVTWRQAHGPFRSLFDLYRVPAFAEASRLAAQAAGPAIASDYESEYFLLAKVANVLTTRSDSFTCYVQVQGWRNAQSQQPELVVRQRRSFIVDRSGAHSMPPEMAGQNFYNP